MGPPERAEPDPGLPRSVGRTLPLLLALRGLAAQVAKVVELGPTDIAAGDDLDPVQGWAVDRVRTFHAHPEADLSDGERLPQTGSLAADHHALKDLDPGPVA